VEEIVMLVVKPNRRRMREMRDSPSEIPANLGRHRPINRGRWERIIVSAGIAGVLALGLIALAAHY
jgi:hypothetical protein